VCTDPRTFLLPAGQEISTGSLAQVRNIYSQQGTDMVVYVNSKTPVPFPFY
jgi:hypothetical protein